MHTESDETPELAAKRDRELHERWDAAERDADPAKAFKLASQLEGDLSDLDNMTQALRLIADGVGETHVQDALSGIANALAMYIKSAQEKQGEIFHVTWAYAAGSRREKPPVDSAMATAATALADAVTVAS